MIELDHLVVAAATLDDGAAWCARTLGCAPAAGGRHPLMGTHNRLLAISSPRFARAYLEIIAIDPAAEAPSRRRWFALDDEAFQARLVREGPQLVHWVARCDAIDAVRAALAAGGPDPGTPVALTRADYRWRITLRDDGAPQAGGALPALIEWPPGGPHPADALPASGVALDALAIAAPVAERLAAFGWPRPAGTPAGASVDPPLAALLMTRRGPVRLSAR